MDSEILVTPSANKPACSRHDLTCALGTGMLYSIALSFPPVIRSGGLPPPLEDIFAPILSSGVITRAMGRFERDSSPNNSVVKSCPARMPLSMRMVDPELPQSSGALGARSRAPFPWITRLPPSRSHATPSPCTQFSVLAQSAPVE